VDFSRISFDIPRTLCVWFVSVVRGYHFIFRNVFIKPPPDSVICYSTSSYKKTMAHNYRAVAVQCCDCINFDAAKREDYANAR
jgi:hypothetical protein